MTIAILCSTIEHVYFAMYAESILSILRLVIVQ